MATGINFYVQIIKIILGEEPEAIIPNLQHAGVRFLLASSGGVFQGLSQAENLLGNETIRSVFLELKSGQVISLPPDNFATQRGAAVIASAIEYAAVEQALENSAHLSHIIINE